MSLLESTGERRLYLMRVRPVLRIGTIAGFVGAALVLNQYFVRFFAPTDLLAALRGSAEAAHEVKVFHNVGLIFAIYALAHALAFLAGPAALAEALRGRIPRRREFHVAAVVAAVSGAGVGVSLGRHGFGDHVLGNAMVGYCLAWWFAIGMVLIADVRAKPTTARSWTVVCYALCTMPLTWYVLIPIAVLPLHVEPHFAYPGSAVLAMALHVGAAMYVNLRILVRFPLPDGQVKEVL
ncbi:MAG: hypothetical protein HY749_04390 [Gammaproteobacteria bacterium]|nr:hypothetical protein [Gammaproteobacteria bacterium]